MMVLAEGSFGCGKARLHFCGVVGHSRLTPTRLKSQNREPLLGIVLSQLAKHIKYKIAQRNIEYRECRTGKM
jgi:hypothetical protein